MPPPVTSGSCWIATAPDTAYPPLDADGRDVDVAVVGGGLVGLTTALLLARAGRSVAVLEAKRIGRQVTGGTTAKVTVQHGLIYGYLTETFGVEAARAYAESNLAGFRWIQEEVRGRQIDCDYETRASYVHTGDPERVPQLEREVEACIGAGLSASFQDTLPLPFPVRGAVRFDGQAQFHPLKYLAAQAEALRALGGHVHEQTTVLDVQEGRPCRVETDRGAVTAREVVVASNIPMLDRGGYFAKAYPYRHMAIAGRIEEAAVPDGMFLGIDEPTRSLRTVPYEGGRLLVAVGEAFPTGHGDTGQKLAALEDFAGRHFGVSDILYRWGNQDYYAADRVPYVGRLLPASRHIRVATGFNAWGITSGTAAAMILADAVLEQPNPWASFYDSTRVKPRASGRRMLEKNLHVARTWTKDHLRSYAEKDADSLAPGEGGIVRGDGKDTAAYRDEDGQLHLLSPICTHMRCKVSWNAAERSWDCPCHGSRFATDGSVLHGPAVAPLDKR